MKKKITVLIDEELDKRFREAIFKVKGMKKGNINKAIKEAIELWIQRNS